MGAGVERIHEKIRSFNRKYYLNIFVRGALLSLSILISYFLLAAVLEYNLWLGSWARFVIMFVFFGVAIFCLYRFLREPMQWWIARRGLSEEQSAKVIGDYVPSVKDRLLNLIQLSASRKDSALAYASIEQKSREFESISFEGSIDLTQNRKYLKYLVIPVFIIVAILIINHSILTQSATRLVHFSQEYSPEAPFKFLVDNESLNGFYNENLLVKVQLDGKALPENVYLIKDNQRLKLDRIGTNGEFNYSLDNLREGFNFQIEAAGFYSDPFNVTVSNRPELAKFNVELKFPPYLQRKREALTNAGNLEVPEGTNVKWLLATAHAKHAQILMAGDTEPSDFQPVDEQSFSYEKTFKNPTGYEIVLENDKSKNKEKIAYHISVIKDEFPKIELNHFKDSVLYKMVVLSGMLSDDHGINKLALHYKIRDENQKELASRTSYVSVNRNQIQQSFFHPWSLDSLKLSPGTSLEYYMQVWDNDGVNGSKSTKTSVYTFMVPTEDNLVAEISKTQTKAQQKLDQSKGKANKLQDQIEQANQKLKGRQSLDWQDKKMLEDILEQKQGLDKMVDELKEENRLLDQKKDAFTEQNDRIREKAEQIQKLMDELLDEETKKLFDELQKLLKENSDVSQIQKILDKLNQNTNNLEKELERTLELFKQLQYDFKLDQTINDLKEQVEKQESLLKETEELEKGEKKDNQKSSKDKKGDNKEKDSKDNKGEKSESDSGNEEQKGDKSESEQLADDQQKLKEQFEKTKEKLDELKELGKDLDKEDEEMPSEEDANDVKQQQEESKEMLNQKSPSKSKAPQKKAIQKMQQMQQQMEGAQSSMSMEVDQQNLETLRHILHGLVKLSFDEEGLMKNFNELSQNDPAFNSVAQRQLKLKDDANVLEDSLLALGKRDPFMGSIVTREIGELNEHLDKVVEANKERRRPQASGEMQLTMTSINNLALMLDEHFDMMMEMMQNAQPSMGKGKKKGEKSSLSQMQQQLNQKIQELKGSGKSGRELSEELAEMAAEQERIRKALQEMQEKMKDGGKMPGGDLPSKMEQTEMDLVNKQLTDQLLKRQQDIVTRLLETEKSAREQDMDEERKGETAKDYEKEIPKAFEEYLRVKEKEVELLKTVPPKLYPYYKKEVSEYFKRVGEN